MVKSRESAQGETVPLPRARHFHGRGLKKTPRLADPRRRPLKYLFLKDLAGNESKNEPKILRNLLIYKYLTDKSLFLKDLALLVR